MRQTQPRTLALRAPARTLKGQINGPRYAPSARDARDPEEGATTVEYAIGTIAAAGFAGLLIVILKSDAVRAALESVIQEALNTR